MIAIASIHLRRVDGKFGAAGQWFEAESFEHADRILANWGHAARLDGGRKVDFEISFADGSGLQGRYELGREPGTPDFAAHLARVVDALVDVEPARARALAIKAYYDTGNFPAIEPHVALATGARRANGI